MAELKGRSAIFQPRSQHPLQQALKRGSRFREMVDETKVRFPLNSAALPSYKKRPLSLGEEKVPEEESKKQGCK